MRRVLCAAIIGLAAAITVVPASAQRVQYGPTTLASIGSIPGLLYPAYSYGGCIWDGATNHDVGPCVNAAITAAAANGGGTVVLPAGAFYSATSIVQNTSGVHVIGAGFGQPRATDNPTQGYTKSYTRIIWNGASGAGPVFDLEPANTKPLFSVDVQGIVFDCNALAAICFKASSISYSKIDVGASEPQSIGAYITTKSGVTSPGTQFNEFSLSSRATATSDAFHPTGILIDGDVNSGFNVSINKFLLLNAWFNSGDGIVFGNSDNNVILGTLGTSKEAAVTNGQGFVVATAGYTMPNGVSTSDRARLLRIMRTGVPAHVMGLQGGATITAGGGNVGSAAYNPLSLSTNSTTAQLGHVLNFASTTGAAAGESISCGPNLYPRSRIVGLTATTITVNTEATAQIASSQGCTVGLGVKQSAVVGTYTLTAVDGTHWNITAPSGGTTDSNVLVSSGILTGTDLVVPLSGTPTAADTFSVVLPSPVTQVSAEFVDRGNSTAKPYFEAGATGRSQTSTNWDEYLYDGTANNPASQRTLCQGSPNVSTTTNGEVIFATCIVPANALGFNGRLEIIADWSYTNSATAKVLRVRYHTSCAAAGTVYLTTSPTTTAADRTLTGIANGNATNSQIGGNLAGLVSTTTATASVTSAIDTTASSCLVLTGNGNAAGDTVTLVGYSIKIARTE